jgi:hypothetical protein
MVFWAATGAPLCASIQSASEAKDPGSSKLWAAEKASMFFLLFVYAFLFFPFSFLYIFSPSMWVVS